MPAKKFSLIEAFPPVINNKLVEKDIDPGIGGIKLIYEESFGTPSLNPTKDKKIRVFLKPLKSITAEDKDICEHSYGKGTWGNTASPLSNIWIELAVDTEDIKKSIETTRYIFTEPVTDVDIIKHLNRQTDEFVLGQDEPYRKLPLTERAKLFWESLRNW